MTVGYDIPFLYTTVPPQLWPFIAVCPLYPPLLARYLLKGNRKEDAADTIGLLGCAVYGILSIAYYTIQPFFPLLVLSMIWVAGYGTLALFSRPIQSLRLRLLALLWIFAALSAQYLTNTFGYFDFSQLPAGAIGWFYVAGIILAVALTLAPYRRTIVR